MQSIQCLYILQENHISVFTVVVNASNIRIYYSNTPQGGDKYLGNIFNHITQFLVFMTGFQEKGTKLKNL